MKSQEYHISRNGYNVSCKLYYEDKKAVPGVVLFGHGFGGHKDNRAAERFAQRALDKLKLCTVTFNWPWEHPCRHCPPYRTLPLSPIR